MKADVLLVDGNSLFMRAGFGFAAKPNPEEANDAPASYVFLKSLRSIIVELEVKKVVLCFDTKSKFRNEYYPAYKGDRKKNKVNPIYEGIMNQLNEFLPIAKALNCHFVRLDGYEADDSLYVLSQVFKSQKTAILTSDLDLVQCVSENVVWYDSKYQRVVEIVDGKYQGKEAFTPALVDFGKQNPNGLTPEQWELIKAISAGDDNIKGLPRFGFQTAKKVVLGEHKKYTLAELYDVEFDRTKTDPSFILEEGESGLVRAEEVIERNLKLMAIRKLPEFKELVAQVQTAMKEKSWDFAKLRGFVAHTKMHTISMNLNDFVRPFVNLK